MPGGLPGGPGLHRRKNGSTEQQREGALQQRVGCVQECGERGGRAGCGQRGPVGGTEHFPAAPSSSRGGAGAKRGHVGVTRRVSLSGAMTTFSGHRVCGPCGTEDRRHCPQHSWGHPGVSQEACSQQPRGGKSAMSGRPPQEAARCVGLVCPSVPAHGAGTPGPGQQELRSPVSWGVSPAPRLAVHHGGVWLRGVRTADCGVRARGRQETGQRVTQKPLSLPWPASHLQQGDPTSHRPGATRLQPVAGPPTCSPRPRLFPLPRGGSRSGPWGRTGAPNLGTQGSLGGSESRLGEEPLRSLKLPPLWMRHSFPSLATEGGTPPCPPLPCPLGVLSPPRAWRIAGGSTGR